MVKWALTPLALVVVCAFSLVVTSAVLAQQATFVSPDEGSVGSRFQIVGESGWIPGEALTLEFTFLDVPPPAAGSFDGPFFRTETITALRDGSWSFPVVINRDLFPFPLWRPGFIAIRVSGSTQSTLTLVTYMVDGQRPTGQPPLAGLGFGPQSAGQLAATLLLSAVFALGIGALLLAAGATRDRPQSG